jgi:hypothetical protein
MTLNKRSDSPLSIEISRCFPLVFKLLKTSGKQQLISLERIFYEALLGPQVKESIPVRAQSIQLNSSCTKSTHARSRHFTERQS